MKDRFEIQKTQLSPEITLDRNEGIFRILGKSGIEDAHNFYQPILNWFEEYFRNPTTKTEIDLYLEYLNSASSLQIGKLMHLFAENYDKTDLQVNWLFDLGDDLMEEVGKEFQYTYELKLEFKEIATADDDDFRF